MKKVGRILVIAILITCLLTVTKRTLTPFLMKDSNFGIASLENHGADILFIGSSMFRQGIDTKDLNLGEKNIYQLSYNGFQPFAEYITLKEVLAHTEIECLVIDMYPYTAVEEPKLYDTRIFQDRSFTFTYDLFSQIHDYGNADYYDLFDMIVQSNNEMFFTWPASYPFINARYYRGSKIGESAGCTSEYLNSLEKDYIDESELNPVQAAALDSIIDLCDQKQIEVIFLETPKYQRVYADYESYANGMQSYLDFLKGKKVRVLLSKATADACLVSSFAEIYEYDSSDPGLFSDLIHISSDGRRTFNKIIEPFLSGT